MREQDLLRTIKLTNGATIDESGVRNEKTLGPDDII